MENVMTMTNGFSELSADEMKEIDGGAWYHAVGAVFGGIGGAIGCAMTGAVAGGAVGTFTIPGIGTVSGAAVVSLAEELPALVLAQLQVLRLQISSQSN